MRRYIPLILLVLLAPASALAFSADNATVGSNVTVHNDSFGWGIFDPTGRFFDGGDGGADPQNSFYAVQATGTYHVLSNNAAGTWTAGTIQNNSGDYSRALLDADYQGTNATFDVSAASGTPTTTPATDESVHYKDFLLVAGVFMFFTAYKFWPQIFHV